jgi:hypothetical protein
MKLARQGPPLPLAILEEIQVLEATGVPEEEDVRDP